MRFHVRLIPAIANWVLLSNGAREDANVKAQLNVFAFLTLGGHPEGIVFLHELELGALHLLLEDLLVVLFRQLDGLLRVTYLLQQLGQVKHPLADVVIRLEQVEVPRLYYKLILVTVLHWGFDVEECPVVEGCLTVLASVVSIRHLLVFVVDVALHKDVARAFHVFKRHVLGVHHTHSHLVVKDRLRSNVPDLVFALLPVLALLFDVEPASHDTLRQRSAGVVDLPVLNGFLVKGLPVAREEPIVKVDRGFADEIVTE